MLMGSFATLVMCTVGRGQGTACPAGVFVGNRSNQAPGLHGKRTGEGQAGPLSGSTAPVSKGCLETVRPCNPFRFSVLLSFDKAESAIPLLTRPIVTWMCRLLNME